MSARTPEQLRTDARVALSRHLRGWLHELDLTQEQLADHVGTTPQKIQRWCDHRNPEVPGASDIALFPRELAARVMRWLAEGHHLDVVDQLAPATCARDHLASIHRIAAADAGVMMGYTAALADQVIDREERQELILRLRRSIEVERAALRQLEQEELAERAVLSRGGVA